MNSRLATRCPLGEATRRVNNLAQQEEKQLPMAQLGGDIRKHEIAASSQHYPRDSHQHVSEASNAINSRLSAIAKEHPTSNRNSQISSTSTNSEGKRLKSHIGPWKLGKTLGKGATARVRLARHAVTGQEAAVKIVQKKNAQLSQAGSLAELDKAESQTADSADGLKKMPIGIEREVAIMKLIQHPHIMKLHDIWENRTEIYLVLEYVENGELFDHISNSKSGRLPETEALRCFRQILSAVGYCHSFNICHRDLKPENILLSKTGQIKIADFGMAALHQGPDHKLFTSCGSPHYAAPELIRGSAYKGDLVDIWSMGVILFAALSGRLPFDVEGGSPNQLAPLLAKIKKGHFEIPSDFSSEAKSLIRKMLQVNPKDRITLPQIWRHPLLRKYDYFDSLNGGGLPQSPSLKQYGRPVLRRSDISKDLLRNLRSLWHRLSEEQLMNFLLSEEPNEQKLFYSLLVKYRDAQLENYTPDIGHSTSDYHHTKPLNLTKTYSTLQFPPAKSNGHTRQVSKFTVISNLAETERSYDPFKASRPQHLNHARDEWAKITIHRGENATDAISINKIQERGLQKLAIGQHGDRKKYQTLAPPKHFASRSSMTSSTRSRGSNPHVRVGLGHKRGVSFVHIRASTGSHSRNVDDLPTPTKLGRCSNKTEVTYDGSDTMPAISRLNDTTQRVRSKKSQTGSSRRLPSPVKPGRASLIWGEDVRQLSSSLAKDCDEAFNRTSVISDIEASELVSSRTNTGSFSKHSNYTEPTSRNSSVETRWLPTQLQADRTFSTERPLPRVPERTNSVENELREARKRAELRKRSADGHSLRYLDRMVSHIDELIQPSSPDRDRRINSAPVDTRRVTSGRPLPSIHETRFEEPSPKRHTQLSYFPEDHGRRMGAKNSRIASAPEPREINRRQPEDHVTMAVTPVRDTIRVVNSMSFQSPVKPPAPLYIRKINTQIGPPPIMSSTFAMRPENYTNRPKPASMGVRDQYQAGEEVDLTRIDEYEIDEFEFAKENSHGTIVKKKSTWFRRSSKSEEEDAQLSIADSRSGSNTNVQSPYERPINPMAVSPPIRNSKKGFNLGRIFRRRNSKPDMTIGASEGYDDNTSIADSLTDYQQPRSTEDSRVRQIAPQRSWLAKLFNVKPPAKYICFSISKRKARREIAALLKDWKRYGIRDVQVDKDRNIVFGRVAVKNYLELKEVSFASEVMTVIEHGKRSHLSIAKFTQEHGAASSFQKVVETLGAVFKCRSILVNDDRKKRMMIKTLNSA